MDHKVSKDMISSGMIPSGEKTQADLGRIQYGSAPSPSSLMDAYKSMYEHHKKDADGNTIPHEGEDIQEVMGVVTAGRAASVKAAGMKTAAAKAKAATAAKTKMRMGPAPQKPTSSVMGTVTKGLQGAAKAAGRADQAIAARGGLKKMGTDYLKKNKSNIKGALLGKTAAGTATRIGGAYVAGRMMGGEKKNNSGFNSYVDMNFHYVPDGDTISEDLFDALKFLLTEEGYDEKTTMKAIVSIDSDLIDECLSEENINEALPLLALAPLLAKGAVAAKGALAAAKATKLGMAAVKGIGAAKKGLAAMKAAKAAKAASTAAKVTSSGGKVVQGASAAGKTGKLASLAKNPIVGQVAGQGALIGGMTAMQPKMPTTPVDPRAATSGKRTAGMRTMDLDLFDVVKGQLLDEGLTEEECNDIMTTLTIDEIKEGLMPTTFKGALVRGAAGAAGGVLAKKGLDKAKEKVDDALNKARDNNPIGGNKRPGADKIYFGK